VFLPVACGSFCCLFVLRCHKLIDGIPQFASGGKYQKTIRRKCVSTMVVCFVVIVVVIFIVVVFALVFRFVNISSFMELVVNFYIMLC